MEEAGVSIHAERSRLVNESAKQIRNLEKELKKRRLPDDQRLAIEAQLDDLQNKQKDELAEFDAAHGTAKQVKQKTEAPKASAVVEVTRNWNSLSKKDLELECGKFGVSKKGGKEDLISRLMVAANDMKTKAKRELPEAETPAKQTDSDLPHKKAAPTIETAAGGDGGKGYRSQRTKKQHKGRARVSKYTEDSDKEEQPLGSSWKREKNRQSEEQMSPEDDERSKQIKREEVMQTQLEKILVEHTNGIDILAMPALLEKYKIKNFDPALLGYSDYPEWLSNQPRNILHYDAAQKKVFPPRVGELPSSDESEEESDADSDF